MGCAGLPALDQQHTTCLREQGRKKIGTYIGNSWKAVGRQEMMIISKVTQQRRNNQSTEHVRKKKGRKREEKRGMLG